MRAERIREILWAVRNEGLGDGLIVVDDTVDGSVADALLTDKALTILRTSGAGQGTARNRASATANSEWLLFLDDDVLLPQGFGMAVRKAAMAAPANVAIIECPVFPVGQPSAPYWRWRVVESRTPGGFLTACLLVRRGPFNAVGGTIGATPGGFREDTDMGLRILDLGYARNWTATFWVEHPLERMTLRRYLRIARFFRHEAVFNRRHPGYLRQTGQQLRFSRFSMGGFRRRIPPIAVVTAALLICLPGAARILASLPLLVGGLALQVLHIRSLRQAGARVQSSYLLDPRDVLVHTIWTLVAGLSVLLGYIELQFHPMGSWRGAGKD